MKMLLEASVKKPALKGEELSAYYVVLRVSVVNSRSLTSETRRNTGVHRETLDAVTIL